MREGDASACTRRHQAFALPTTIRGCHLAYDRRVQNALNGVAGNICQALPPLLRALESESSAVGADAVNMRPTMSVVLTPSVLLISLNLPAFRGAA